MAIRLFRVDERLLHGQVTVGWGERLGLDYYVVVDRSLAESGWEQELYASAVPDGIDLRFVAPDAPPGELRAALDHPGEGAVLTRGTSAMRRLGEAGLLEGETVNLGALHASDGRQQITHYLYLSADELEDLRALERMGAEVQARDLPGSSPKPLEELIDAADPG